MKALTILVIDDDAAHAEATAEIVARLGHRPCVATSGEEGIARLAEGGIDVVVTDLAMRDRSGLDVVAAAEHGPEVIVITGYGTEEAAPAFPRPAPAAYLVKPLGVELFRRTLAQVARRARAQPRPPRSDSATCSMGMVGASPAMQRLFDRLRRVADSRATVLVEGESGTGKELVARALHDHSPCAGGPYVAVNCAALSAGLLESELFGHERGAFTGAFSRRIGRFEAAHGGTLFLDEVGEMDAPLQAKLLRALEEREIVRVGGNDPIEIDVRVVAATNRSLKERVAEGAFRADLYYRLNVVRLVVPPLRERAGDVGLLTQVLFDDLAKEHGVARPAVDAAVLAHLADQDWRGNVRELRNCVETMLLTCADDRVTPEDLPGAPAPAPAAPGAGGLSMRAIADVERELIRNTLRDLGGNRIQAAEALGISVRTLYRRIKELGL